MSITNVNYSNFDYPIIDYPNARRVDVVFKLDKVN